MIVIDTSDSLAQILSEVHAYLEPDTPMDDCPTPAISRFTKLLLLRVFRQVLIHDPVPDLRWLLVLRKDPILQTLLQLRWSDIEVIDSHGTFLLMIEE